MIQVDVSRDGSCMLHSIALAYLIPIANNDEEFEERFKQLFGEDQVPNLLKIKEDLTKLEKGFASISSNNDVWKSLIQKFRERLVEHIKNDKSEADGKNKYESFFACDHSEDYRVKYFNDYLVEIKKETTWLGDLEMRATSDLLRYPIQVNKPSLNPQVYNGDLPGHPLELFHFNENHYKFGLDEGLAGPEEFNQKSNPNDDSDSSGDENCAKRDLFNAVERNDFEKLIKILDNFKGDLKSLINALDANNDNNTPLHMAIKKRSKRNRDKKANKKIIDLLIMKGADSNAENDNGKTPLNLTKEQLKKNSGDPNWQSVKELLEQGPSGVRRASDNRRYSKKSKEGDAVGPKKQSTDQGGSSSNEELLDQGPSGVKRASDNTGHGSCGKKPKVDVDRVDSKRQSTDQDGYSSKRCKLDSSSSNSALAHSRCSGQASSKPHRDTAVDLEKSLHGDIFQLKVLMLFLKRGTDHYDYFRLYSELPEAEKFNDLVFGYRKSVEEEKLTWRYVQVKHKLRPDTDKIKLSDLESTNYKNHYGLKRYFESFCNIKDKEEFQGGELEVFIFITNCDFEEKAKHYFIETQREDKNLRFGKGEKIYKLIDNDKTRNILKNEIKQARSSNKNNSKQEGDMQKENIKNFIEKFCLVVNYPSEDQLGDLIKDEVVAKNPSLKGKINLIKAKLLYDTSQRGALDWFKSIKTRCLLWQDKKLYEVPKEFSKPNVPITPQKHWEVKDTYDSICKEINSLVSFGLGQPRVEKLRETDIHFETEMSQLKGFLSSEEKQIFHFITRGKETTSSAIRVLWTLEGSEEYKEDGDYIFMPLSDLLPEKIQELAIDNVFSLPNAPNLLVIECKGESQDKIDCLHNRLKAVLNKDNDKKKKIVLIAQRENALGNNLKESHRDKYQKEEDQNAFKDLDADSQYKVLKKEVNFQGKDICLNQLLDKDSAGGVIDEAILSRLLDEQKITIGDQKDFSSIGYVEEYYIKRKFHRQEIKIEVLKERGRSERFFVTGADQKALTDLGAEEEDMHLWTERQIYDKGIIWLPSGRSGQNNKEIYQDLSKKHSGKNIHWLTYHNRKLFYIEYNRGSSKLDNYIDMDPQDEATFSHPDPNEKVVVLANDPGMGKSIVLTSVAWQMKRQNYALWVLRVNLNDYAFNKEKLPVDDRRKNLKSLKEILFKENNINEAIKFVSEMVAPGDSEDPDVQFQRKLFKAGLEKPKDASGQKPKIVILFDGFDEISPTYKENTLILLKTLKRSEVTQLWVTTRVHEKAHLEDQLESPAYILNGLTEKEQMEYLNKKLAESKESNEEGQAVPSNEKNSKTKEARLFPQKAKDENAEKLLDQWITSIRDKEFTTVPLNLKMLAEVVVSTEFQRLENLGLLDLYDEFIKVKLDIYYREKAKATPGNEAVDAALQRDKETLYTDHCKLARKLFFPRQYEVKKDRKAKEELARVGLLTLNGGKLEFIHRSFAEYFLSEYLIKNLGEKDEQVLKLLMEEILLTDYYALVRKFFNGQLNRFIRENNLKHLSKVELTDAAKILINKNLKKDATDTVLLRAAREGHLAIVKFLCDILTDDKGILKKLLNAINREEQTALHLAALSGSNEIVKFLLDWMRDNHPDILKEMVLATDEDGATALYLAAREGHTETFKALFDWVKDNLPDALMEKLKVTNEGRRLGGLEW